MKPLKIIIPVASLVALLFIALLVSIVGTVVHASKIYVTLNGSDENTKRFMNLQLQEKSIPQIKPADGTTVHANGFYYTLSGYQNVELSEFGKSYTLDGKRLVLMPTTDQETDNNLAFALWDDISKDKNAIKSLEKMTSKPLNNEYDLTVIQYSFGLKDLSRYDHFKNKILSDLLYHKRGAIGAIYHFDNGYMKGFQRVMSSAQMVDFYDCNNPERKGWLAFTGEDFTQEEIDAIIGTITFEQQ